MSNKNNFKIWGVLEKNVQNKKKYVSNVGATFLVSSSAKICKTPFRLDAQKVTSLGDQANDDSVSLFVLTQIAFAFDGNWQQITGVGRKHKSSASCLCGGGGGSTG